MNAIAGRLSVVSRRGLIVLKSRRGSAVDREDIAKLESDIK